METYQELKKRHADEFETLPIFWAFGNKQLEEGMQSFGLTLDDLGLITSLGAGGYIRKTDVKQFHDTMARQSQELTDAIDADQTGEDFIFNMFNLELGNHEYCVTHDPTDAIEAVGLDESDIENSPALKRGLSLAIRENNRER